MILLIDEQLPRHLAFLFTAWGLTAHWAPDLLGRGASDTEIWVRASRSGGIIVTKDRDFLTRPSGAPACPRLLFMPVGNMSRAELLGLLGLRKDEILRWIASDAAILILSDG